MHMRGVGLFAKATPQDRLSDDPARGEDIAKRILSAAEKVAIPSTGVQPAESDLARNDLGDSKADSKKIRPIGAVLDSDFFPILLLIAIYTLAVFGATLLALLWWMDIL